MVKIAGNRKGETYPERSAAADSLVRLIASGESVINDGSSVILGPFTRAAGERVAFFIYPTNMEEGERWGGEGLPGGGTQLELSWRFLRNEIADPNLQFNVQIIVETGTETSRTVQWAAYGFSV